MEKFLVRFQVGLLGESETEASFRPHKPRDIRFDSWAPHHLKLVRFEMPSKDKEKVRLYQLRYYRKNTQYYKDKARAKKEENRRLFTELKKMLGCRLCPEDSPCTLDFHHYDPSEKHKSGEDGQVGHMVMNGFGWSMVVKEIKKCICLCSNCHRKVHAHPEEYKFISRNDCVEIPSEFLEMISNSKKSFVG
jgi:hypothetical protein